MNILGLLFGGGGGGIPSWVWGLLIGGIGVLFMRGKWRREARREALDRVDLASQQTVARVTEEMRTRTEAIIKEIEDESEKALSAGARAGEYGDPAELPEHIAAILYRNRSGGSGIS